MSNHILKGFDMAEFTEIEVRAIERAHQRLDDMQTLIIKLQTSLEYQEKRIKQMEDMFRDHMLSEEKEIRSLNNKLDAISQYRWIALGIIGTIIFMANMITSPTGQKFMEHLFKV